MSVVAAGLHRLDRGTNQITTASEYKRRLISAIYCTDKNEASMNGVPVGLSYKFIHLRLPLDISEDDLFLPQRDLANLVSQLDPNGWNTKGEIYRMTMQRAIQVLSRCREDILELALGVDITIVPQQIEQVVEHQ